MGELEVKNGKMKKNTKVIFLTLKTAPMHSNQDFSATAVYILYIRQVTYNLQSGICFFFFFTLHDLAYGYWFICIDCFLYP